ncbi:Carbonyl reductase family member 4 [Sphaceloma murrayae]|uniref:Peroxisomal trans-2-enoyl-CoA reductase n=1 Tax=Sphaceloma murrayae TaxID=2082308 RepID=A0A2K1QSV3_9PEZI|nr:Carbonyl reductase family member 4 [Sphaceloma murrayae]
MSAPQSNGAHLAPGETESQHFSPYRSDGKLYGFVCVVIGANHPVGQAIISELAAHGAASIYACTLPSHPTITPPASPSQIIPYPYLPTEEGTLQLIDDVLNSRGRLDIYITLATLLGPSGLSSTTPTKLSSLFEANALVPFYALKYAPPAMGKLCTKGSYVNAAPKEQKYGSIIVVGGMGSEYGGEWGVGWTMSLHAAMGVVRAGVKELRGTGVRINGISFLSVEGETSGEAVEGAMEISGLGRKGRAEEVARVAGFLASGFSSYVTGSNMVVDGGARAMNPLQMPGV